MSADGRLPHYPQHLPMAAVEGSYDARPCARNAMHWVERSAQDFDFDGKAFRLLTGHPTAPTALPENIREAPVKGTGTTRSRRLRAGPPTRSGTGG
jgi:uncharacterized protein YecE (DUF72 family)